jgi:DNA/RNA endonuclease YhcR with UshA esterase domain
MDFFICDEAGLTLRKAASMLKEGDIVTVNGRDRIVIGETGTIWTRYYFTRVC